MQDRLIDLAFWGLLGLAAVSVAWFAARWWGPRARARNGLAALEFNLIVGGPVSAALITVYPVAPRAVQSLNRGLVLLCLILAAIAIVGALRRGVRSGIAPVVAIIVVFYGVLLLSCLAGAAPGTVPEVYWSTPLVLLAFVVQRDVTLAWFLWALRRTFRLTLVLSAIALVVVPDLAFNTDEPRTLFGVQRIEGITGHPNTLAIIVLIGLLLEVVDRSWVWAAGMTAALIFCQSHTVWITTALALACLTTPFARFIRAGVVVAAIGALMVAIFNPSAYAPVIADLGGDSGFTLNGRTRIWAAALQGFIRFPLLGYGPTLLDEQYRAVYLPGFDAAAQAHDQWVQSLSGTGLVGLATAVAFGVVIVIVGIRRRPTTTGLSLALPLAFLFRTITETPLDPFGPSLGTVVIVAILGLIAFAPPLPRSSGSQSERGDASASGTSVRSDSSTPALRPRTPVPRY